MHDIKGILRDGFRGVKFRLKKSSIFRNGYKPSVINMMANDICNSKCMMCNIWEQKLDFEITPKQLKTVLQDQLFDKVTNVGITGGEPTMREDLPELYGAACQALPSLKRMSVITNAIKEKDVIRRITESAAMCQKYNVGFGMMVSLDGKGEVHDKQRGRDGNYKTALNVIQHFKQNTDIPVAFGCTITKSNVWDVDDLLYEVNRIGIYGRFRVAEFINRLYNNDLKDKIRAFNDDEIYQLMLFFQKLINAHETNFKYKRTYRSIQSVISGQKRLIGCPYQSDGVVLDSRGVLLYCAPKSKNLDSTIEKSAKSIFFDHQKEKKRIKTENCDDCVHDYHAEATLSETIKYVKEKAFEKLFSVDSYYKLHRILPSFIGLGRSSRKNKANPKTILITGWYGTETVGDKAILAGIVMQYLAKDKDTRFVISAIYPFIVERTISELKLGHVASSVPLHSMQFFQKIEQCDEVIIGGGPLMEMNSLSIVLWAFKYARKNRKKTIIYGCGVGPIYTNKFKKSIKDIYRLSDQVLLRDINSKKTLEQITAIDERVQVIQDPAYEYVLDRIAHVETEQTTELACFLRDWPLAYRGDRTTEEFEKDKDQFYKNLAKAIKEIADNKGLTPVFYSMHNFVVGGDDRDFYRNFVSTYYTEGEYKIEKKLSTVDSIIKAMKGAEFNLVMRYHSVLFANTIGNNFTAIDYTNGGKIKGYLDDHDKGNYLLPIADIVSGASNLVKSVEQKFSSTE